MRACTAVVTEISYNSSEDPSAKYRGEIEFIEPADWEKDLKLSLAELKDDNGGVRNPLRLKCQLIKSFRSLGKFTMPIRRLELRMRKSEPVFRPNLSSNDEFYSHSP